MKIRKHQTYRTRLSFSRDELHKATLGIEYAGVNLGNVAVQNAQFDTERGMSFGWFGGNSDMNKFYPGLNVKDDVIPKPEDYVLVPFRLLSAAIVGAGSWKATDFSDAKLLKGSMSRLMGKPVYYDHDTDLNNWVGFVQNVTWSDGYQDTKEGIAVPAGIDSILAIDAKVNPKMARGVLSGAVFSNSVTVEFDWKPSHNFSSGEEFDMRVGTLGDDGQMVRRIAVAIYDYHETSLVWLGADPFAKLINQDGTLKNIDVNSIAYDKATDDEKQKYQSGKYNVIFGTDTKSLISLSRNSKENFKPVQNNNNMNKFLLAFLAIFGSQLSTVANFKIEKEEDLKDEHLDLIKGLKALTKDDENKIAAFTKFAEKALAALKLAKPETEAFEASAIDDFFKDFSFISVTEMARLQAVETEVATLKTEKTALETKVADLKVSADIGDKFSKLQKEEAVRLYKAAVGDQADAAVVTLIESAKPDQVEGLLKQYTKGATAKFKGSCAKCGSDDFNFKSSYTADDQDISDNELVGDVSSAAIINKFSTPKMFIDKK